MSESENESKVVVMTEFTCLDCAQTVSTKLPRLRVINCPEFSSVTFVHQIVKCPCGTHFMPTLSDIREDMRIRFNWIKVKLKETPKTEIHQITQPAKNQKVV
jgi:DNA-directed RNA polymerase subunit RPC12/RpoP